MTTAAEEQAYAHGYYARDAEVEGLKTQLAEARQAIGSRYFLPGYTFAMALKRRKRFEMLFEAIFTGIFFAVTFYVFVLPFAKECVEIYEQSKHCLCFKG